MSRWIPIGMGALVLCSCETTPNEFLRKDGGSIDAAIALDSGVLDSGAPDRGAVEGGLSDRAAADRGAIDTGPIDGSATGTGVDAPLRDSARDSGGCEVFEGVGCYWQTARPPYCWVRPISEIATYEECRAQDSCRPGGGSLSMGGCYKWAASSDEEPEPWR